MRSPRQVYYDAFSALYDRFVALHSGDARRRVRAFLAGMVPAGNGERVLDLCTGTGALLPLLSDRVGPSGVVAAVDFSKGMLGRSRAKTAGRANVLLVQGRAESLPFAPASFQAVTCSHAFYELKGEDRERALQEIVRVLRPEGTFLMMEHDVPRNQPAKALFYFRLAVAGGGRARRFLKKERSVLERHFAHVEKVQSPSGRSKVWVCTRSRPAGREEERC
jgi:demethylmenaquinone methyltransferase/2-methoxy-6-polyprenyl-1,4-benzoquinol methylase